MRGCAGKLGAGLAVALAFACGEEPPGPEAAAELAGEAIPLEQIDARLGPRPASIRSSLERALRRACEAWAAERLALAEPPARVAEVTDAEVDAYRAAHLADFEGPRAPGGRAADPALQRAAIRHLLEREARLRAEAQRLQALRDAGRLAILLPAGRELERPLAAERVLARLDAAVLRGAEVEQRAALPLYRLRGELHRARQRALEEEIEARLLAREARRRGVSPAQLEAELAPNPAAVTEAALAAHREQRRTAGEPLPDPAQLRPYLAFRAAQARREALLGQLRATIPLVVHLRPPPEPRLPLPSELSLATRLGPATGEAPRLVAYLDYRCSACRAGHAALDRLREQLPGLRLSLRDFVPLFDPGALEAAQLARCAADEGRFAALRASLLARDPPAFGEPWYDAAQRRELVRDLGLDPARFEACVHAPETLEAIERDTREALALGFVRAPAYVAEGVPLSGLQSAAGLAAALRRGRGAVEGG